MRFDSISPLEVYLLGLVDFDDAQLLHQRLIYDLGETRSAGSLILCEHPPTISVGRSGSRLHIEPDDDELRRRGITVRWVNRGGGCVLHRPGQITAYLAVDLQRVGLDVRAYVDRLFEAVLNVLGEFNIAAWRPRGRSEILVRHGRIATVGVAVKRWIAYHGLTVNVGPRLDSNQILQVPGPSGVPLRETSMEARRQRPAPMNRVRESLLRHLEDALEIPEHHLYTHHPLIRGKARPYVHASSAR